MDDFRQFAIAPYKVVVTVHAGGRSLSGRECDAEFVVGEDDYPHLWFRSRRPPAGQVAHECLHLVVWAVHCRSRVPLDVHRDGWDEVIGYPLEYAVDQCRACLAELRAKNHPRTRKKK